MTQGYLLFHLHAHLPFVRHPEHPRFLEEFWLYEAISETYLPLLRVFERLEKDGVPFSLSMSVSPTLISMLTDPLLQERYVHHLHLLLELGEKEQRRVQGKAALERVVEMYLDLYRTNLEDFESKYARNIVKGFDYFYKKGYLEIIPTAATHAYLPLFTIYPSAVWAQISLGMSTHLSTFGLPARGFWLPECGYEPGLEEYLHAAQIDYFFTAAHGILFAERRPEYGIFAPVRTPSGVVAFGRDPAAARAVWSSEDGYPADPVYRDFYRDVGYELPLEDVAFFLPDGENRVFTGYKYHAITGRSGEKEIYDPDRALARVEEHAAHFVKERAEQVRQVSKHMPFPPAIVCPYDAELFGHWWFEGPAWLEAMIRKVAEEETLSLIRPSDYLKEGYPFQENRPSFSSWGTKGYSEVWLDGRNDWIYRHLHAAVEQMEDLVERFSDAEGLRRRALNQAARELLLAQASDWPFIIRNGTMVPYALRRIKEHLFYFRKIYDAFARGALPADLITGRERRYPLFGDMDYRVFARANVPVSPSLYIL
ncbi:Domain of unknown function DUF1957 [Spirochaeta thermophila DSM 6578]|uniref:Glycoside hydrolase family 57 n=1 Tax=Winmispira thermophila (strain ATCC 700085 / DSM 6578 / Z-1203) TaxID=869211 RepID=G0GCA4_WINT7|nr:1,4-alpha-glucan branching protein domain-containing protein [Spirochaeta thermophila]AEJ61189.1 Domain of unknown function DUF1957 [Spirochaeta thermophila DSM 6578]